MRLKNQGCFAPRASGCHASGIEAARPGRGAQQSKSCLRCVAVGKNRRWVTAGNPSLLPSQPTQLGERGDAVADVELAIDVGEPVRIEGVV